MTVRGWLVLVVLATGCTDVGPPAYPETNFDLLRFELQPTRVLALPYTSRGSGLVDSCCPRVALFDPTAETVAVCRALQVAVERGEPHASSTWGPHCQDAIQTDSLLKALRRKTHDNEWTQVVRRLAERDPTEQIRSALFQALMDSELPSKDSALAGIGAPSWYPATALAVGGEDDLGPLVQSLSSNDPAERLWAAHVFMYATSLPLDLPELLPQLDRLEHDPDPRIAERARVAAAQYRSLSNADVDSYAALAADIFIESPDGEFPHHHAALAAIRLQEYRGKTLPIRVLSRRRAFCDSRAASIVLEMLRHDGDVTLADLATRASKLRSRRCQNSPVGD